MRFELVLFAATAAILGNIYTEGKVFAWILSKKKYYQMASILIGAFVLYWSFRRDPATSLAQRTTDIMKYLPVDSTTSDMIAPILDFTSRRDFLASDLRSLNHPILPLHPPQLGGKGYHAEGYPPRTKRSVSETRKRLVASGQNWKCLICGKMLSAYYEIDHIRPLEHGGNNEVSNLRALCRDCHASVTYT